MPLDPVLAQGVQLPQFKIPDYASEMAQMAQLQSAQNQNALAQYQLSSAKRSDEQQNAFYNAARQPGFKLDAFSAMQFGAPGMAAFKAQSEAEAAALKKKETEGNLAKQKQEFGYQALRDLSLNPSNENIIAFSQDAAIKGFFTQEESLARAQQLLNMPVDERKSYLASQGAGVKELMPLFESKPVKRSDGQTEWMEEDNPRLPTYGQRLSASPVVTLKPSPGEALRNEQSKAQLVESQRHAGFMEKIAQGNLEVARQKLKIAEKEVNSPSGLSPESTDILAQVYLQTGNLPPLGSGQNAANSRQAIFNRAAQLSANPSDAAATASGITANKQNTAAAQATVKDFTSGISSRKVTANNTAINHLETMEKLADDLNNKNTNIVNKAGNLYAEQTGSSAPTNFDAAKQLVAAEVIKAVVNNGGGVKEREEAAQNFNNARSPAQLKGVIKTYKELLGGQLQSLGQQYEVGSGRKDFQEKFLSPNTRKILPSQATNQPNKAVIDDLLKKY